jgi:hypothetical protein
MLQKHTDFDTFMAEIEADPANADALTDADAWIAATFYGQEAMPGSTTKLSDGLSCGSLPPSETKQ